jgi:hypothetical protein
VCAPHQTMVGQVSANPLFGMRLPPRRCVAAAMGLEVGTLRGAVAAARDAAQEWALRRAAAARVNLECARLPKRMSTLDADVVALITVCAAVARESTRSCKRRVAVASGTAVWTLVRVGTAVATKGS